MLACIIVRIIVIIIIIIIIIIICKNYTVGLQGSLQK